jgi:hypothetical protein
MFNCKDFYGANASFSENFSALVFSTQCFYIGSRNLSTSGTGHNKLSEEEIEKIWTPRKKWMYQ